MKQAIIVATLFIAFIALLLLNKQTRFSKSYVTIKTHATYIILPYWLLLLAIALLLLFVIGITAAFVNRFTNIGYNSMGAIGLVGMFALIVYFRGIIK